MRVTRIVDQLAFYLSRPVILGNQAAVRPEYPYIAINETTQYIASSGYIENVPLPEDIKQVYRAQAEMILSVTAYDREFAGAANLSEQAHAWFTFAGRNDLKNDGYVVVSTGDIINRDGLLIDDYERRRGFDVRLRFIDQKERFIEEIKHVEGTVNNLPFRADKE